MQPASATFVNKLKKAYSVTSDPKVTVEWNCNRFGTLEKISNNGVTPDEEDPFFPLDSIIDPNRPEVPGLVKGITSLGVGGNEARTSSSTAFASHKRTYTASPEAKYKYWVSPNVSSSTMSNGGYALSNCVPTVLFKYRQNVNKLVVQFEDYGGTSPLNVVVEYTEDGVVWNKAGTNYSPSYGQGKSGRIELYLQDDGTWSPTVNLNNFTLVRGIKATVPRMSKPRVHCHIIELAMMHQIDVTDRTIGFSTSYTASEASFVAPIGKAETATGSLDLSNVDGFFDANIAGALLWGRNNSPAKVQITNKVTADGTSINSTLATMYVEDWGGQTEDQHSWNLSDASMFLKTINPPAMMLEGLTGAELIWRLLDSVGFTNYTVDESPDGDMRVRYFWSDPEKTVWDHIKEICEGLQIACYFDEYGTLRIKSREKLFEADKTTPEWIFDGQKVDSAIATEFSRPADLGKLADIVSLSKPNALFANKVVVEYSETKISDASKGIPKMDSVWGPDGTVALRTANLASSITRDATTMHLTDSNFATWPYEGMVQLNGEIIKWTRKRYEYVNAAGVWAYKYISSNAEKAALDGLNSSKSHKNYFSGRLYIGGGRGLMSTYARDHSIKHRFAFARSRHGRGDARGSWRYCSADYKNSVFRIRTGSHFKGDSWCVARRGLVKDQPPRYIGTSLKFDGTSAYSHGSAGVFLGGTSLDSGYYVELSLTSWAGKRRGYTNEVCLYVRRSNGTLTRIGKGAVVGVSKNKWYDLDVYQRRAGSTIEFSIDVNGVTVLSPTVTSSNILSTPTAGAFGVFARGNTHVAFEYLYAANSIDDIPAAGDDASRWDAINGGYRSNYYNRYLYNRYGRGRLTTKSQDRLNRNQGFFFDEFGSKAHEIREFKVDFEPSPVTHSRLYISNESYADCIEYVSDHKSARFIIAGKGRDNVILNGEDTLLYGKDNPVDQKMFVYGRTVKPGDEQTYEVSNNKSVRRTGEVELVISSPWIQSEAAAKKIGDWVANHWGDGSESIEIESFGNPLIQIGDVVGLCYMKKGMGPILHQYYVTGVSQNYSEGLSTTYNLQRKTHLIT